MYRSLIPSPAMLCCAVRRLLEDVLRTLPCQDPLASTTAWQEVKASDAYKHSCRLAETAFDAAEAVMEMQDDAAGWEMLLARARCLRKQQQPAVNWLPLMARACHYASSDDSGVLLPVYALHASRMRLLLAMPSAPRWAHGGGSTSNMGGQAGRSSRRGGRSSCAQRTQQEGPQAEHQLLQLVGSYCFLPASNTSLRSPGLKRRRLAEAEVEKELQADWQALLEDCCAAMRWCLDRHKDFHRAAYRCVPAARL